MDLELMGPDDHPQAILTRQGLCQQPHVRSVRCKRKPDVRSAPADAGDAGEMQVEGGRAIRKKSLIPWLITANGDQEDVGKQR